jgi:phytoene dehydrogenase-like protein
MGMVSFYFCDAAREAGATVVSGVPVAQIFPAKASSSKAASASPRRTIVSNADPRQTLRLLGPHADPSWRARKSSASPSKAAP